MLSYEILKDVAPRTAVRHWEQQLRSLDPKKSFGGWPYIGGNWGVVAMAGEAVRHLAGLRSDVTEDIETQLAGQDNDHMWTLNGIYQDHTGCDGHCNPTPYDHFARKYIEVMLARKFPTVSAKLHWERLRRAAWTSVLMQSPWGEMPTGGRSSQHQWNEAVTCVTYEIWASKLAAEGNVAEAGIFKRAAALSMTSLRRWKQSMDGPWWVVKNRFDPSKRHGYEGYSFFSQYNLLPASMLATAYLFADDTIKEGNAFAEVGGFVFNPYKLGLLVANAGGNYVQLGMYPDHHDSLGLSRMHSRRADPFATGQSGIPGHISTAFGIAWQVAPDSSVTPTAEDLKDPNFTIQARPDAHKAVPAGKAAEVAPTPAPIRTVPEGWQRLGMFTYAQSSTNFTVAKASPAAVDFSVQYVLNRAVSYVSEVEETYHIDGEFVNVSVTLKPKLIINSVGEIGRGLTSIGLMLPLLTRDGQRTATHAIDPAANIASVEMPGDKISGMGVSCGYAQVWPTCGEKVTWSTAHENWHTRNGLAKVVLASLGSYDPACPLKYAFWSAPGNCKA